MIAGTDQAGDHAAGTLLMTVPMLFVLERTSSQPLQTTSHNMFVVSARKSSSLGCWRTDNSAPQECVYQVHTHRSGCIVCGKAFGEAIRLESMPAISNVPPRGSGGAWGPDDLILQSSLPLVVSSAANTF